MASRQYSVSLRTAASRAVMHNVKKETANRNNLILNEINNKPTRRLERFTK